MENQGKRDEFDLLSEDFPDEFQCCVCLDILYKPVVLGCGHISCFWCIFKAMDNFQESHCPVCRHPYSNFPRICTLLHFLLLKLYPSAYKRRERQIAEEEKEWGHTSPQFEERVIGSDYNEAIDMRDSSSPLPGTVCAESNTTSGDSLLVQDSLKVTIPCEDKNTVPETSSTSQNIDETNCMVEHKEPNETLNKVLIADLQCAVCKQLLCCPVVLNCGHVSCEACIDTPQDGLCKCPLCRSPHPNGFPNVCLVLEHFLEEHFSEEYSARKQSRASLQNASPSGTSTRKREQTAECPSVPTNAFLSWMSGHGAKVHPGVGCDYCGMYPIIGKRYKCKDCVEAIGFDLCEECYNSSSKLPGRFNQQHTPEHKFTMVPSPHVNLISLESVTIISNSYDAQEHLRESSNGSSESEVEIAASGSLSDDDLLDPGDDSLASQSFFNDGSTDPGDHSAN